MNKKSVLLVAVLLFFVIILFGNSKEVTEIVESPFYSTSIVDLEKSNPSEEVLLGEGETYSLDARFVKHMIDGKEVRMIGYNGQIPGPIIKVKEGETAYIEFTNNLDMETTVHWHGIRLKNEFDGVPDVTQDPVLPGESFTYEINFKDEGVYWYHPHIREDYQQELGLYGNIIVEPTEKDYYNAVSFEEYLILDDISFEGDKISSFDKDLITNSLMGRFGDIMLINGNSGFVMDVKTGVGRFFITNVANTRTMNISFSGLKIKMIGSDIGSYVSEKFVSSFIIAPAERYIVEVLFDEEGTYEIVNNNPLEKRVMGEIVVSGEGDVDYSSEFNTLGVNNYVKEDIATFEKYFDNPIDYTIDLTVLMKDMMNMQGMVSSSDGDHDMMNGDENMMGDEEHQEEIEWEDTMARMNSMSNNRSLTWIMKDRESGKENMDIDYSWDVGDIVKIRLFNDPGSMHPMQHPIHFHGQRFLVLEQDGVRNENLVWKDTVLVPVGSSIDIILEISNPGDWMAHCHIAEHLQTNMMMMFNVG
jgi:suppressor of ftsI